MSVAVATFIVRLVALYLALGCLFALAFVTRGVGRIDPAAARGTWGFRVLIFPGTAALWPLLLRRWWSGASRPPAERNPHRDAAKAGGRA